MSGGLKTFGTLHGRPGWPRYLFRPTPGEDCWRQFAPHSDGDGVQLVIANDGRGFSPGDLDWQRRDGHVGLSLLRDLVADAGGDLHVESHPGGGTRVSVEVRRSG
ncbi:MAG TPA: ATP-binding protein [Candidatus Dormibacteraeota bacterium]